MVLNKNDTIIVPGIEVPSFRTQLHLINHQQIDNILFVVSGGIGDVLCAEPTIRFAKNNFTDKTIKILCDKNFQTFFRHLDVVFVDKIEDSDFVLHTMSPQGSLINDFFCHFNLHPVDYCSLVTLKTFIPTKDKVLRWYPDSQPIDLNIDWEKTILIHTGTHWETKTLPKEFLTKIILYLLDKGYTVIAFGKDLDETQKAHVIDIINDNYIDLTNKLSLDQVGYLLKQTKKLITNDSFPLHAAVAANPDIEVYFFTWAKHPDLLKHWRLNGKNAVFGHKMYVLNSDGLWKNTPFPYQPHEVRADKFGKFKPNFDEVFFNIKKLFA